MRGAGEGPPFSTQRIVRALPRRAQWWASRGVAPNPARQNSRCTCASLQPRRRSLRRGRRRASVAVIWAAIRGFRRRGTAAPSAARRDKAADVDPRIRRHRPLRADAGGSEGQSRALSVRDLTRKWRFAAEGRRPALRRLPASCSPSPSPSARPPVTACRTSSAPSSRAATRSSRCSWSPSWRRWSAAPSTSRATRGAALPDRQHAPGPAGGRGQRGRADRLLQGGGARAAVRSSRRSAPPARSCRWSTGWPPATRSRPPRWRVWCWRWPAPRWPRARSRRGRGRGRATPTRARA